MGGAWREGVLGDKLDRRRLWVLVIACVATALVILSINLPTVILPEIAGNLSASFAEQQWLVNAYALSLAALLLTAGSLSDRLGRKRVFVAGLVRFLLSSLLCGLAWDPVVLDLARAAQGVGGAVLFAGSLAILGTPVLRRRLPNLLPTRFGQPLRRREPHINGISYRSPPSRHLVAYR
jgi:MFS family permease